ncbi:MAG: hypothetical protein PVSMB8_15160 [Vulcanimicrobiaceae bacterium]
MDIVAIVIAQIATIVCTVIVVDVWLGHAAVLVDSAYIWRDVAVLAFPVNIYAWVTVLTASLRSNRGVVAGLLWPGMLGLAALAFVPVQSVHNVARVVDRINPVAMYTASSTGLPPASTYELGALISFVLLGLALAQWRRLES